MKATVFVREGVLEIQDKPKPEIKNPDDVILRVAASGICGSDLHGLSVPAKIKFNDGVIIGHEFSGIVDEAGPKSGFSPGEKVALLPQIPCHTCSMCRTGKENQCLNLSVFGAYERDGGNAEYVASPSEVIYRIDEKLDVELAALAEPVGVVLSATTRIKWHPGLSTLIFGAGPIGLIFLMLAKSTGVSPLIVVEPKDRRRETALEFGADVVIDPSKENVTEAVRKVTDTGADIIIDAVGTILPAALDAAGMGAQIVVFGIDEYAKVEIPPVQILKKEVNITGTTLVKNTFELALKLLAENKQGFDRMIVKYPLTKVHDAISDLRAGKVIKALLIP